MYIVLFRRKLKATKSLSLSFSFHILQPAGSILFTKIIQNTDVLPMLTEKKNTSKGSVEVLVHPGEGLVKAV